MEIIFVEIDTIISSTSAELNSVIRLNNLLPGDTIESVQNQIQLIEGRPPDSPKLFLMLFH